MEKIVINQINWKKTVKGNDFASIYAGNRWLSFFPKKGYDKSNFMNRFMEGEVLNAEVVEKNGYFNIVTFTGEENLLHYATPKVQQEQSAIKVPQEIKEELKTSSEELLNDINIVVDDIVKNSLSLEKDKLTNYELTLAALNVKLGEKLAENNAELKTADFIFKQKIDEKIIEIMANDSNIKKTPAKEKAEVEFQLDKAQLIVLQNKFYSAEIINSSINSLIFALKDRIKQW